jgi:hypothetical protein
MSGLQGALKFWQEFNVNEFQVRKLKLLAMPFTTLCCSGNWTQRDRLLPRDRMNQILPGRNWWS